MDLILLGLVLFFCVVELTAFVARNRVTIDVCEACLEIVLPLSVALLIATGALMLVFRR
jgi:NADH:ubiquinone oxidoreductase subunit H